MLREEKRTTPGAPRLDHLEPAPYERPESLRSHLLSPALVVYLDRVRENVRTMLAALGGDPDRWRPHTKTTKLAPVFAELIAAGVRAFKCATTREAACLLGPAVARRNRQKANAPRALSGPPRRHGACSTSRRCRGPP